MKKHDDSPTMSPKGTSQSGAFPDFHHKMSKKIAQLTKVIYNLNTKNDDHEFQLKSLADTYENEIEEILQDTSKKINHFRELLEKKKNDGKVEEAIKTLAAQHNREKQKALEEFEQFKRQSRVRETKIMQESQDKIQKLTKELDMARDEFSGQVSKFSQLAQQIEVKYSKDSVNMKEVHAKEIEDLVQKYNKQYNDMLTRMMNEQDELEKRLQKEFEDKIAQLKREGEIRLQLVVEDESEKRKNSLDAQRREFEKITQYNENEYRNKTAQLNEEIERLKGVEAMLNERLSKQLIELNSKDNHIGEIKSALQKAEQMNRKMNEQLDSAKNELQKTAAALQQTKAELQLMKENMHSTSSSEQNLRDRCNALQLQIDDRDIQILNLNKHIESLSGETSTDKQYISDLNRQIREANAQIEDFKKLENSLRGEIEDLKASILEERGRSKVELERFKDQYDLKMATMAAQHDKDMADAAKAAAARLSSREETLMHDFGLEKQRIITEYLEKIQTLDDRNERMRNDYEELKRELSSMNETSNKGQGELRQQIENLQKEKAQILQDMRDQLLKIKQEHAEEIKSMDIRLNIAESQNKGLQQQLDQVRLQLNEQVYNYESAQKTIEDLKKQINDMNRRVQNDMEEAGMAKEEELAKLRRRLDSEWDTKMALELAKLRKTLQQEFDADKNRALLELSGRSQKEKLDLEDRLKSEMRVLEDRISSLQRDISAKDQTISTLEEQLQSQQRDGGAKIKDIMASHKAEIDLLLSKYLSEQEKMRNELQSAFDSRLATKDKEHASQLEDLRSKSEMEKKGLVQDHLHALDTARKDAENRRIEDLNQLEIKKKKESDDAIRKISNEHAMIIDGLEKEASAVKQELLAEVSRMRLALQEREREAERLRTLKSELEQSIRSLSAEVEHKTIEVSEQRKELLDEMRRKQKELNDEHKQAINQMVEEHITETQALNEEFNITQQRMEEIADNLQRKVEEWETRYKNRESRQEDIDRIRLLERDIIEKEQQLQKALNEVKYFKLELLNREENYNKTFGRPNPNVGLINPLAAKTSSQSKQVVSSKLPPLNGSDTGIRNGRKR